MIKQENKAKKGNASEEVDVKEEKKKTAGNGGAEKCENCQNEEASESMLKEQKLQKENDELNERLLRQMAEFDNFRKRTQKEKEEMLVYSKGLFVKDMLSVLDNFERALSVQSSDEEYKKGMEMIFNQFIQVLTKLDVVEIEAYNLPFDPTFHNAISQVENAEFGENTVCQVLQKGYKIGEKVVRHAMVVVANS